MNENAAYAFEVELPTEWSFRGGKTWISGWFVSKTAAIFRDMRAWIDDRPFTGVFGIPRPEIEARFRGRPGLPYAGFSFLVEPHKGARLLRLELLDHGNNWVEIWRQPIRVSKGPASGRPRLDSRSVPDIMETLLKEQRRNPGADILPLAQRELVESATEQLTVKPSPPFWGALESPGFGGHTQYGKLPVKGWLIHLEQPVVGITAMTDPLMEHAVAYGLEREDAITMFPQHDAARRAGFYGMVDLIEGLPNPAWVNVFAQLADGTRHLVFVQRFRQLSCNRKELPYPEYHHRNFAGAMAAGWKAARRRNIRLPSPAELAPTLAAAFRDFRDRAPASLAHLERTSGSPYDAWIRHHRLGGGLVRIMRNRAEELRANGPSFCIVADMRGATHAHAADLAKSLAGQIYPNWELWLVLPGRPAVQAAALQRAVDEGLAAGRQSSRNGSTAPRHRAAVRSAAAGSPIAETINEIIRQSTCSHVTVLPASSRLSADALLQVAEKFAADPALELVYSDEDRMHDDGRRESPSFKPGWSPALAISTLLPGHLSVLRRERLVALAGLRPANDRVLWDDALLRAGDTLDTAHVAHVALILHHARAEVPATVELHDPSVEETRRVVEDAVRRRGLPAEPFLPPAAHERKLRFHQLRWSSDALARLPVTIVIPTRDRLHLLQECFELLNETVDWKHARLVIVDDHSRDTDALAFLEKIQSLPGLDCTVLRPADPRAPFNYSHLVNLAVPHVHTPLLLHLNNDVNALEPGWLEEMAGWFAQPDVGVVGAKLIHPDRSLNHTGIVVGPHGGLADTPYSHVQESEVADPAWCAAAREVSAVTGACLLTRTELYSRLGGFNESEFSVAFNDVDYCLRAGKAGYRVLYTPQAKLMHWGSATRGVTFDEAEHIAFVRRYSEYRDPYLNPSLALEDGRLVPSASRYMHADRAGRLRVLLITHNFNYEGAPLFLLEYATHLVTNAGFHLEVVSTEDGPLRKEYEKLGAAITFVDRHRIFSAESPAVFHQRVGEVHATIDFSRIDLVVCNTLVGFWGVHLARLAAKPSLFYIHESTSIYRFFEKALPLPLHRMVEEAFMLATRSLFLCRATESYYKDLDVNGGFRRVPSWIAVDAIEEFKRLNPRDALRKRLGFGPGDTVVANIGTVCERKGQHTFIRAIAELNRTPPAGRRLRYVLVGGRPSLYFSLLQEEIRRMGIDNIEIVMETPDAYSYFHAADLFVCTSFEESFPRVVLEAMAFRTPIVSTDVHGIPEMVTQRQDAYLVPPGDDRALARMIRTCLDKELSGKSLTPTAYSRVLRHYDRRKVLPRHVDLAREACLDFDGYPTIP